MQAFCFGAVGRRLSSSSRLPICAVAVCSALVAFSGCEQLDSTLVKLGLKKDEAAAAGPDVQSAEPKIPQVGVYTVKTEAVPLILELPGRTAAFNVAEVRPQVSGIVLERKFEEGVAVEEGQQLYQIDDRIYVQNRAKAKAQVDFWTKQNERVESLINKNATSQQDADTTANSFANAQADFALAELNIEYCRVEAPISGRVGFSQVTEGALVTTGQGVPMTTIQQIDRIYVDLKPSVASALATLHPQEGEELCPYFQGATVEIELEDGTRYPLTGKVERVDNSVEASVGTVAVRAVFDNPNWKDLNGALLPGMFVRAFVEYGSRPNGILVPQQGVFRNAKGEPYVWVLEPAYDKVAVKDEDGKEVKDEDGNVKTEEVPRFADLPVRDEKGNVVKDEDGNVKTEKVHVKCVVQRPIVSERTLGNMAVVESGLKADDRIVVEGVQFIASGGSVDPVEATDVKMIRDFEKVEQAEAPADEAAPEQNEAPAQAE